MSEDSSIREKIAVETAPTEHAVQHVANHSSESGPVFSTGPGKAPPVEESDELEVPPLDANFAQRYTVRRRLGSGGMGDVRVCTDNRIGRNIALKVLHREHASKPELRRRFLREARVQGQLEHPAVVPVHDLGLDADGRLCFTMKQVRGETLGDVLELLQRGNPEAQQKYSQRKLLSAFCSVCLAVDFAHSRSVLHRDLKPSNIMLGDFGEVHVLDWGVARIASQAPAQPSEPIELPAELSMHTMDGALVGTPGFMSPEQAKGTVDALTPATDVYALGAILFQILALEPLHNSDDARTRLMTTLRGNEARPSVRAPNRDIPPELDAICAKACALKPEQRYASARSLCEAVERFLDGDRDVQRRKELADEHAERARQQMEAALRPNAPKDARAIAMREASRALALNPENITAAAVLARLMLTPPEELPPEVEQELERRAASERLFGARIVLLMFAALVAFLPWLLWMGVRDAHIASVPTLLLLSSVGYAAVRVFKGSVSVRQFAALLVLSNLTIMSVSGIFGPFIVLPSLLTLNTTAFTLTSRGWNFRYALVTGSLVALFLPLVLELLGFLPRSYTFLPLAVVVHPRLVAFTELPTFVLLLFASVSMGAVVPVVLGRVRDLLLEAERRLLLHSWSTQQVLPAEVRLNGYADWLSIADLPNVPVEQDSSKEDTKSSSA